MSDQALHVFQKLVEDSLDDHILYNLTPIEVFQPMVYSLESKGKRLRPILLLATLWLLDVDRLDHGISSALALEYIHTYSLIHDDLPAMDDDDFRRGKPSAHKKYNEATAILSGDGLLTDAFNIIVADEQVSDHEKVQLVLELSEAAGPRGMVAGQVYDMKLDNETGTLQEIQKMHSLKTGQLFKFAVRAAGVIGNASDEQQELLDRFAIFFGRGFQIHNDLMDATSDQEVTGKETGQDCVHNKLTYTSLLGIEGAIIELAMETEKAREAVDQLTEISGRDFSLLKTFLTYLELPEQVGTDE